ncbi:DMT family transporter [Desulfosediminicola ganghwensis]|uniref:DMT family transporter n=1 Tax=Desulfosediminicola ganghwensis TaxID=2569540 RepID=UPI0010ABB297|nr:DMT family transporter [Desulfosediminicola ganghwensis]
MNRQQKRPAKSRPSRLKQKTHFPFVPLSLGLASALLFGLATPASKILLGELNIFLLAGLLYLGAALGVIPIFIFESRRPGTLGKNRHSVFPPKALSAPQTRYISAAIVCGGFLGPLLLLQGLKAAQASSVAIWLNLELVATAILGVLFFRDHLGRNGWTGVLLATAAGVIITFSEGTSGLTAALLVTLACICWGFDNHCTALIDSFSAAGITLLKGIFAGSFSTLIGIINSPVLPDPLLVLKALLLGVICYGLSIVLYVSCAQQSGATRAQILFSSSPFFGVALAVLLLGEEFSPAHLAALCCLAGAIYFSQKTKHYHLHSHEPLSHTHLHRHNDDHHNHDHTGSNQPKEDGFHSHHHDHRPICHSHPHYPDLHHRHQHDN